MDDKAIKFLLVILSGVFLNNPFSASASQINNLVSKKNLNPCIPHVYLSGYEGKGASNWLGKLDILAPLLLREDRNLFIYGQGRYSDYADYGNVQPYSVSIGVGYRQIVESKGRKFYNAKLFTAADKILLNDTRLFGMHLIADYASSPSGHKYWDLSPGFETLGAVDFRINGYIPFKKSYSQTIGSKFDHFYQHQEFDRLLKNYEKQGIGLDAEIGLKLFSIGQMPIKGYIDGYVFNTENTDQIKGVGGRVTFQPTRYLTFEFKNIYDNVQHNVFMGGIKLYLNALTQGLGNTKIDSQGMKPRLYEPIERNFASIGSGSTIPYIHGQKYGEPVLFQNQIIFVRDPQVSGLEGDGTYENPYIYGGSEKFQDLVDAAYTQFADYSYLYFAPGTYDMGTAAISFHSNQAIVGRSADFATPAVANEVTLVGGINLANIGNLKLSNFQLLNREGLFDYGIVIDGAQANAEFIFDNVIVGGEPLNDDPDPSSYRVGVGVMNIEVPAVFDINKSSFYGVGDNIISGLGFYVSNELGTITLSINNSVFYGKKYNYEYPYSYATGLFINNLNQGVVAISSINNSIFTGVDTNYAYGLYYRNDTDNDVIIGDIVDTTFITNSGFSSGSEAVHIDSSPWGTSGNVIIANIIRTNIFGHDRGIIAYSNNKINIGNIEDSIFSTCMSQGIPELNYGRGVDIYAKLGVSIGNINNSQFIGNSNIGSTENDKGTGMHIASGDVVIGDIRNSIFYATNTTSPSATGLFIDADNFVYINNVVDSSFSGNFDGLYINADNIISFLSITNSSFAGKYAINFYDFYGNVVIGGSYSYATATELYNALSPNNEFVAGGRYSVCLSGGCV